MNSRSALFLLVSATALALGGCSSSSDPTPWMTQGDTPEEHSDALMSTVLDPALPGCSAAVARNGQVVWADAVGSAQLSSGTPLTTSTVFDFASNSKHVTGMAILVLVADGKVSLDSPVAAYLPDAGPWAATTTVEQLLHHTSGLPDYISLLQNKGVAIADPATQAQAMDTLANTLAPEAVQPWAYSNSNYIALASIVEAVSGESFADFAEQRLFAPMGLSLAVDPLASFPDIAARYHARTGNSKELSVGWDVVGDGAVVGTPTALAEWFDVLRTGLPDDPAIADAMVADAVEVPGGEGITYGAGIFVSPEGFVWHTGEWEGHVSYLSIDPDRSATIAIACNFDAQSAEFPTVIQGLAEIWYGTAS